MEIEHHIYDADNGVVRKLFTSPESQIPSQSKLARAETVKQITVTTTSGKVFDGDETSQNRMVRAIVGMGADIPTIEWKLSDNTIAIVTVAELREALLLAGQAQTQVWFNA